MARSRPRRTPTPEQAERARQIAEAADVQELPLVDRDEHGRQSEAYKRLRRDQDQLAVTFITPTGTQATRAIGGVHQRRGCRINPQLWPVFLATVFHTLLGPSSLLRQE